MEDHSNEYRAVAEIAEREYDELLPTLLKLNSRIRHLRAVINHCSALVDRPVDEHYSYSPPPTYTNALSVQHSPVRRKDGRQS